VERVIKSDGSKMASTQYFNTNLHIYSATTSIASPTIGQSTGHFTMRRGILQLERNITIQGRDAFDSTIYSRLLQPVGTLIMKDGSAVKEWVGNGSTNVAGPIYITQNSGDPYSRFIMEGGEISGCTKTGMVVHFSTLAHSNYPKNRFVKTGGRIISNTASDGTTPKNMVLFGTTFSPTAAEGYFAVEEGAIYFRPELGK
jgi:hypothetical protein